MQQAKADGCVAGIEQRPLTLDDIPVIVIIVLALGMAYFAFDKFVLDPARDAEIIETETARARTEALFESYGGKSIVVLPFLNMSNDAEQDFFADGISEDLTTDLSKVAELFDRTRDLSPDAAELLAPVAVGSRRGCGERVVQIEFDVALRVFDLGQERDRATQVGF